MTIQTAIRSSLSALAISIVMLSATGSAFAQSMERLAEADTNGDGNIEWQEMLDMRAGVFARLDRNGDGYADSKDAPRMGPGKSRFNEAMANVKGADANGDGRISKSEMLDAPAPLFAEGDTNGDKVLNSEELASLRESAGQKAGQK
jgi:Ca2+-binding EF-hand superfamily protein